MRQADVSGRWGVLTAAAVVAMAAGMAWGQGGQGGQGAGGTDPAGSGAGGESAQVQGQAGSGGGAATDGGAATGTVRTPPAGGRGPGGGALPPAPTQVGRPTGLTEPGERPAFRISIEPKVEYTFGANLRDGPGRVSVFRTGGDADVSISLGARTFTDLAVTGEYSRYRFRDATGLGGAGNPQPLRDAGAVTFAPSLTHIYDENWSVRATAIVRSGGEKGAFFDSDSFTYGGLLVARYAFNPDFALSFGAVATSRLEESALVLPLVGVEWNITERLRLETRGLGVRLTGTISPEWRAFIEGGFDSREYRLDDDNAVSKGVLRDRRVPIAVGVQYTLARSFEATIRGGAVVYQQYRLDDRDGNEIRKVETQPAGFIGGDVIFRF